MQYTCIALALALLLAPLRCHAQSEDTLQAAPHAAPTKTELKKMPLVEIRLKNGQKLVGRWADSNCINCYELIQKDGTRILQRDEVANLKYKQTFWQKVADVTCDIGRVISAPLWLPALLLYIAFGSGCN
jgi:hypothetical protein